MKVQTKTRISGPDIKVADEVWIATALLHREQPKQPDFTVEEIVERVRKERLSVPLRPGVYVHVVEHCVANRHPSPGRSRILIETSAGRRRLFRKGDSYHPGREGSKHIPKSGDIPPEYVGLLQWYENWCKSNADSYKQNDPLLSLRGSGKHLWADEHADDYVRRLREAWE